MKSILVSLIAITLFIVGCEQKKVEPAPVGELSEYRDPGFGFKIKYPNTWKQFGTTGKAVFAVSQDVIDKFQNTASGIEGSMVTVEVMRYEGKTADAIIQSGKDDLKQMSQNIEIQPDAPATIGGKQATSIQYAIPITTKKKIIGTDMYVAGDTAMYKISVMNFGDDQVTINKDIISAMTGSFELPVVIAKKPDVWAPSANMETFKSDYFTLQYPDNMEFVDAKKGSFDLAFERRADRFDCTIHVDVFGAKGLTVEKVWEQNKGKYKAAGTGNTTIDGVKALWVNDSPRKDASRRTYFVVKNDKVVRLTLNWFAPQKDVYFPVLDKCVTTLKLK